MLRPGTVLSSRYRLDERIASGGMGDVWKAEDTVLGRTVAVKVLLPALLEEQGFVERFRGEARTMATINHPGVVDVYDYGEGEIEGGGKVAYLVMEYIEGEPLSRPLAKFGRLTPQRTMALIAQAADALHAAHERGIIHRDVKPGNLLVRPNGTLVLTDFGIARSAMTGQLTAAGSVLGTAAYISPEQAAGSQITPLADVYALGVVTYQCLTGRRPFEGENPLEIAMRHVRDAPPPLPGDVPPGPRHVVERAMAKDSAQRWPSAAAMAEAARRAGAGDPMTAGMATQAGAAGPTGGMPVAGYPTSGAPVSGAPTSGGPGYPTSGAPLGAGYPTSGAPTSGGPPVSPAGGYPPAAATPGGTAIMPSTGLDGPGGPGGPGGPPRGAASVASQPGRFEEQQTAYHPGVAAEATKRSPLLLIAIAAGVLVLLVGGGVALWAVLHGGGGGPANTGNGTTASQSAAPTASATPSGNTSVGHKDGKTVHLNVPAVIGRQFDQVSGDVQNLGLRIDEVRVRSAKPKGEVVAVPGCKSNDDDCRIPENTKIKIQVSDGSGGSGGGSSTSPGNPSSTCSLLDPNCLPITR